MRLGVKTAVAGVIAPLCLALVPVITSCSSTPKKADVSAQDSASNPARFIASDMNSTALESEFQAIFGAQDGVARMTAQANRIVRIHFRAFAYIKEFDDRLKSVLAAQNRPNRRNAPATPVPDMMLEPSYAKLIAARRVMENEVDRVGYYYLRLLQTANDRGSDSPADRARQDRALELTRAFRNTIINTGRGVNQLAYQNLYAELLGTMRAFQAARTGEDRGDSRGFAQMIEDRFILRQAQLAPFHRENAAALDRARRVASADREIGAEIEALSPEISASLREASTDRESRTPQNARDPVRAEAGANGNLTGNTFARGVWALTYDDGPHGRQTPAILGNLQQHNMKATFFWLAQQSQQYPSIVQNVRNAGMLLANHSFTHANLPTLGSSALQREIVESSDVHARINGSPVSFFRCPYGACGGNGSQIRQLIASVPMIHVFWNVDSLDWQDKNPSSVAQRVRDQMAIKGRGIVLFHDIHPQSTEATRMLMDEWEPKIQNGTMRLITIDTAVEELTSPNGMPGPANL